MILDSSRSPIARASTVLLLAGLLLAGSGCAQIPGFEAPTPTPVVRAAKPPARPTAVVKRAAILETIKLLGRVTAVQEAELYFNNAGRLKSISARSGQDVAAGQLLAELDTGDLEARVATAQVNYETTVLKLDQLKAKQGDAELRRRLDLATAALAVQQAEGALSKAESDLVAVKAGLTPVETAEAAVRDAQLALDNAKRNFIAVQKSPVVARDPLDRENEHNWYEANYGQYLAKYERGEIGKDELNRHWDTLMAAKERLDAARVNAASAIAGAEAQVSQAEDKLKRTRADFDAKKALPPDSHIKDAERVVASARLALDKVQAEYTLKEAGGGEDYEMALQAKAVDQARTSLDELQAQLHDSRLVAPFAGKVMVVRGRIGEQIPALQPIFSIADPETLQVRGDLIETDLPKVALGQEASVLVDAMQGATLRGTVVGLPGNFTSQGSTVQDRSVQIKVDWPPQGAQLGMLARVTITVQKKNDVLVVPARAVKTVGKRRFVEYMEGSTRRSSNVEVGVVTETEAEIVSGLTEGQVILSGQ
ncbi:MAG: HlyD family efflux transporter periplasmic adaptor subunit [Chloroflexi bacterium]|nr:HlyD family efflux transporter periplasmic adaptor subunit [Chloroflexota bacterium]